MQDLGGVCVPAFAGRRILAAHQRLSESAWEARAVLREARARPLWVRPRVRRPNFPAGKRALPCRWAWHATGYSPRPMVPAQVPVLSPVQVRAARVSAEAEHPVRGWIGAPPWDRWRWQTGVEEQRQAVSVPGGNGGGCNSLPAPSPPWMVRPARLVSGTHCSRPVRNWQARSQRGRNWRGHHRCRRPRSRQGRRYRVQCNRSPQLPHGQCCARSPKEHGSIPRTNHPAG